MTQTIRQTMGQVLIKSDMGLFRGITSLRFRFHWKFWSPVDAVGGRVYFGWYGEYDADETAGDVRLRNGV